MSTVHEIENAIKSLTPQELVSFRHWYAEFDAELWDAEIERDAIDGKLDFLVDEAFADLRDGRIKEL